MNLSTREPLIVRGAIVAAITALIHVLVVLGVLPIDESAETAIAGAIDLIGTAILVAWTRGAVTPVADPQVPMADPSAGAAVAVEPETGPKHLAD